MVLDQKYWELEFFVKNFGRRTVGLLVDMSYENSATYEILSFKITSIFVITCMVPNRTPYESEQGL